MNEMLAGASGEDQVSGMVRTLRLRLGEISSWRLMLPDVVVGLTGLRSPAVSAGGGGDRDPAELPFRLGLVVDDLDDGAAGVRTDEGLEVVLGHWAESVRADRARAGVIDSVPSSAVAYLAAQAPWAAGHCPDFEDLCDDVARLHSWLAGVTGHAPVSCGQCPCGGVCWRYPGRRGLGLEVVCDACGQEYASPGDVEQARLHRLRSVDVDPSVVVSTADLVRIWSPEVSAARLRQWRHRGVLKRPRGVLTPPGAEAPPGGSTAPGGGKTPGGGSSPGGSVRPGVGMWPLAATNAVIRAALARRDTPASADVVA